MYSVTKTLTATAVGLAIGEGTFALTDRVVDLLAADAPVPVDPLVAQITVHHLLSMSTGHDVDTLDAVVGCPAAEWARRVLAVPQAGPVGSRHVYNNGASFLLGEIIRRCTGNDLSTYLTPRLWEPLGIEPTWDTDPAGRCLGWSGLHVRTADLAVIGELYRCDGVWDGRRLLPAGWVKKATTGHIATTDDSGPEWRNGYGYQLWLSREGYRLDGAFGQYALVLPEHELVIAIQSAQEGNQRTLDFVFEELIPALPAAPVPVSDGTLPVPADLGRGEHWAADTAVPDSELAVDGVDQGNLPRLTELRADRGALGFRVAFVTEGTAVELECVPGSWRRQLLGIAGVDVPVALAAGVAEDGSLLAWLVFTDTPHTVRLRLRRDGSAGIAWTVPPLGLDRLSMLRAG